MHQRRAPERSFCVLKVAVAWPVGHNIVFSIQDLAIVLMKLSIRLKSKELTGTCTASAAHHARPLRLQGHLLARYLLQGLLLLLYRHNDGLTIYRNAF